MKSVALYGGSFDPPHIGHIKIVEALSSLDFIDEVVIMPAYTNPFKSSTKASGDQRLDWLKKVFANFKSVEVDSFEIKKGVATPTIESVEYLRKKYKNIYLTIGADNLAKLHLWHDFERLQKLVKFIVISRDDIEIPKDFFTIKLDENVSSTSLREDIDKNKLPATISDEIVEFYNS